MLPADREVIAWPKATGKPADLPRPIKRPCDWNLEMAVTNLETQLGTIEAYNRLVVAAAGLKTTIDAGRAKPQNPLYATNAQGGR